MLRSAMATYEEISPRELKPALFELDGISRASIEAHYKLYQGYVSKRNEILQKLESVELGSANQVYSELRALETLGIRLEVNEFERIGGSKIVAECFVLAIVEQVRQAGAAIDAEVFATFRANVQVLLEILLPDNLPAAFTLHPQAFGANFLFAGSVQLAGLSFEPGHKNSIIESLSH